MKTNWEKVDRVATWAAIVWGVFFVVWVMFGWVWTIANDVL